MLNPPPQAEHGKKGLPPDSAWTTTLYVDWKEESSSEYQPVDER